MKQCKECGLVKSLEEFYRTVNGFRNSCKECKKAYQRSRPYDADYFRRIYEERGQRYKNFTPASYLRYWRKKTGKSVQYHNNRRALELNAEGTFTAEEFSILCKIYGNCCLCCGIKDVKLTVDHIVPLSKGGSNSIDNIQPLCGSCNSTKGIKEIDYR